MNPPSAHTMMMNQPITFSSVLVSISLSGMVTFDTVARPALSGIAPLENDREPHQANSDFAAVYFDTQHPVPPVGPKVPALVSQRKPSSRAGRSPSLRT
jgi:hypothetical protein